MSTKLSVKVTVNGELHERQVEPRMLLSDFLRHELGLTGTHVGCEHGMCGACTILLEDQPVRSCLTLAVQVDGKSVRTVESLAHAESKAERKRMIGNVEEARPIHETLGVLQAAFWENQGLQCGFCTPGVLMTAQELLRERPAATRDEIREFMSGNLCRCTGYQAIIDAIEAVLVARRRHS